MPTSVAQPRKRTLPGLWALIGAVVVIVAIVNLAVFVGKLVCIVLAAAAWAYCSGHALEALEKLGPQPSPDELWK